MTQPAVDKLVPHWSSDNQQRAGSLLNTYPEARSTVMPLLYIATLEHGYVTADAMRDVASLTGLTAAVKLCDV